MSTTDRELLELAAKAAGIVGEWVSGYGFGDYYYNGNSDGICYTLPQGNVVVWNPLTDDGDALRLAVKLQIIVGKYDDYANAAPIGLSGIDVVVWSHQEKDPCAATRRAIVRAAAAIGEAMK